MYWTTPTLVEICIGLEINGYLPAEFWSTTAFCWNSPSARKPAGYCFRQAAALGPRISWWQRPRTTFGDIEGKLDVLRVEWIWRGCTKSSTMASP